MVISVCTRTGYPKSTNAERHNKRGKRKNGSNNSMWIFCTNFGGKTISHL